MAAGDGRTEEFLVELLVLEVLADGHVWENAAIREALRSSPHWTAADRQASPSRKAPKWHSSVNNVLAHDRGLYAKGQVQSHGEGAHKITATGRHQFEASRRMSQHLRDAGIDDVAARLGLK